MSGAQGSRLVLAMVGVAYAVMTPARPPVVSQTEWDAALSAITKREEAVAKEMHDLAAARKRMPMVRVERDYDFEGPDGQRSAPSASRPTSGWTSGSDSTSSATRG
jgi:Bacterial protein of unknown function (DUF899)